MIILLSLCTFMLPLFAADEQKKDKTISTGELLCELVIHNGMIAPSELIRFPCISKHINFEASKKLREYRLKLKNYVEKDWHNETDLKKRIKLYNQAIQFLRHKRITWKTQNKFLIQHDSLSNTISVFEAQKELCKIIDQPVPASIDSRSIKVYFDAQTPLYNTP